MHKFMLTVGHYFIFSHVRNKIILKFTAVYTFLRGKIHIIARDTI